MMTKTTLIKIGLYLAFCFAMLAIAALSLALM